jgi:hypothetical protein
MGASDRRSSGRHRRGEAACRPATTPSAWWRDWLRETLAEAHRGTLPGMVQTGATFADAAAEWLRFELVPAAIESAHHGRRATALEQLRDRDPEPRPATAAPSWTAAPEIAQMEIDTRLPPRSAGSLRGSSPWTCLVCRPTADVAFALAGDRGGGGVRRHRSGHRSSTTSSRGLEQQMNTLPSVGGSTGSGL